MAIRAAIITGVDRPCSYLDGRVSRQEEFLVDQIDEDSFSTLIENGYRHFGQYFFRPVCADCHECMPIRIDAGGYRFSRSARRLRKRNQDLQIDISMPVATTQDFDLYRRHKRRFSADLPPQSEESYEQFCASFFHPFPFARTLRVRDRDRLIAVSHFDVTGRVLSAVYCYYDLASLRRSPGRFAIYTEIAQAIEHHIPYVYLGYYIAANPHMRYKVDYAPNQLLLREQCWADFVGPDGDSVLPEDALAHGFQPHLRLCQA